MLHKLHPQIIQVCIVLTCIISFSLTSCKKTIQDEQLDLSLKKVSVLKDVASLESQNLLKERFATLLSNVIKNDKETRLFLKEEAIKQFDLDYDILYHLIKDKKISNNESLHDKLLKYSNEKEFGRIESELPLLTIFIPELPGGFSAETWDAQNDIPDISTAIISDGKVTFHTSDGNLKIAEAKYTPGFPLIVLKDCERVQLEETVLKEKNSESGSRLSSGNFNYRFISDAFNGIKNKLNKEGMTTNSECLNCALDPKVETSYWLGVNNPPSALWQRDYVYYTISPNSPNGPLDTRYQEHLTSIKFNSGLDAYFHMTDQAPDPSITVGGRPQWSEGSYEIKIVALINNTNGLGSTISKTFPVKGSQLFYVTYYQPLPGFYYPDVVTPIQYNLNLPLAAWDIKSNGIAWKIILSEVDPSQTITQSETISSTFAGNFGVDFSKIGLKFGLAPTFNNSATYSILTQMGDDALGDAAMYFYDPIIVNDDIIPNHGPWFEFKDINTGWATLNIQPKKVFQ